jgi:hypothetical protein
LTPPILEVIWNRLNESARQSEPATDYFGSNYAHQLASRARFFMMHNRGLWHWLTVLGFVLASFASFVSVVEMKAMKPFWLLLRAREFWKLFAINLGLTYVAWALSVYWGIIPDSHWMAILALAAVCPTAAGAYGDMFKRYMPAGLSGIIRILEELSERLLERVNQSQLYDYKAWLAQFPLEQIKHAFYEVLFGELENEALRARVLDRTKMHLDAMAGEAAGDTLNQAAKTVYINAYLTVLSYLSSGEDDLWRQLQENGFATDATPPQMPLAS